MKPFIKWAGGKERELKHFSEFIPNDINNYIEPFLGGGAVFFSLSDTKIKGTRYINDFSKELIDIYKLVKKQDDIFFDQLNIINFNINRMSNFANGNHFDIFVSLVSEYCEGTITNLDDRIYNLAYYINEDAVDLRPIGNLECYNAVFFDKFKTIVKKKLKTIKRLKESNNKIDLNNLRDIFETALQSAFYMLIRYLYNSMSQTKIPNFNFSNNNNVYFEPQRLSAMFYYIRQYCYSSMFRYNDDGDFNVPYGGMSYNSKDFNKCISNLKNVELINYLNKKTVIKNLDFEVFINKININEKDFMFIDPPYDSEFSEYAQNEFDRNDQTRLADLLSTVNCRVMVVIKNTDFIYKLYKQRGFYIASFDKKYTVNFMNRNNQNVKHLIITNYKLPGEDNVKA